MPTLAALASAGAYMGSNTTWEAGVTGCVGVKLSAFLLTPFLTFVGVVGGMIMPLPPLLATAFPLGATAGFDSVAGWAV